MQNWPEIPLIATLQAILEEKEKGTEVDARSLKGTLGEHLKEAILNTLKNIPQPDSPCTCEATVICSNSTDNSEPVKIEVEDGTVSAGRFYLLKPKDIKLKKALADVRKVRKEYVK